MIICDRLMHGAQAHCRFFAVLCAVVARCLAGTVVIQAGASPLFNVTSRPAEPVHNFSCCEWRPETGMLICTGVGIFCTDLDIRTLVSSSSEELDFDLVRDLTIRSGQSKSFRPRDLALFSNLRSLAVIGCHVESISGDFPKQLSSLERLNLSGNALSEILPWSVKNLVNLKTLDISQNNFTSLNKLISSVLFNLTSLDLSGNPWDCSVNLTWLLGWVEEGEEEPAADDDEGSARDNNRLLHPQQTLCNGTYAGKPLLPAMRLLENTRSECPDKPPYNCTCGVTKIFSMSVNGDGADKLSSVVLVNCSGQGLTDFPPYLPTTGAVSVILDMSRNRISGLATLVNNGHYRSVVDLYLDNNRVRSISQLEGSDWFYNFRLLSLRGNYLSQLPTYALDDVIRRNSVVLSLFFGNNPWKCDCVTTPNLWTWLTKYQSLVKDIDDIRCSEGTGDGNSLKQIKSLSRADVCSDEDGGAKIVNYLDLLNGTLAALIILLIGKLLYDYWTFKKTGKLPWIVSKIP